MMMPRAIGRKEKERGGIRALSWIQWHFRLRFPASLMKGGSGSKGREREKDQGSLVKGHKEDGEPIYRES